MDALEFVREKKRMCDAFYEKGSCGKCPAKNIGPCAAIGSIEKLLPIVEKWSAEYPKVRNVDHVAEGLEKLGYKVDKEYIANWICPVQYSGNFYSHSVPCPEVDGCDECRKWWLEEYKGEDINALGKGAENGQKH